MKPDSLSPIASRWLCGLLLVVSMTATGCQVEIAGQTLPSPYYLADDIQYFAPGPEFMLAREAAAMQKYQAEKELQTDDRRQP
tara:strand:- start:253 stop:501 length:249 start_codon:yes stop_codon:yes gene_type:complete